MSKRAISVTLEVDNLTWLQGRAVAAGRVSVSGMLDRLIQDARASGMGVAGVRSVAGTVQIPAGDPELMQANAAVRAAFGRSLKRTPRAKPRKNAVRSAPGARG